MPMLMWAISATCRGAVVSFSPVSTDACRIWAGISPCIVADRLSPFFLAFWPLAFLWPAAILFPLADGFVHGLVFSSLPYIYPVVVWHASSVPCFHTHSMCADNASSH